MELLVAALLMIPLMFISGELGGIKEQLERIADAMTVEQEGEEGEDG